MNAPPDYSANALSSPPPTGTDDRTAVVPSRTALPSVPGYELLHELGRGGMGVVYLARDTRLNRYAAVKMLLGAFAPAEQVARFRTEAQAVAALNHPAIVQLYEAGEVDGLPYFALEYCAGGSLEELLRAGPLAPRRAAEVVRVLAEAMAAAHAAGIVHRDLKPSNILLSAVAGSVNSKNQEPISKPSVNSKNQEPNSNRSSSWNLAFGSWNLPASGWNLPKVSDFGLAKRGESNLTQTGIALGTPAYMAPEQASGMHVVGPPADIHALGLILYECLTARKVFQGSDPVDTLLQVRMLDAVPPSRFRADVPKDLETICLKCLEKEPSRRYASASDLADDLGRWLDGLPIVARPVGPVERAWKWAKRRPVVAGAVAAAVLSLVIGTVASTFFAVRATERAAEAERAGRDLRRQLSDAYLDRGLALAESGEVGPALHWMAAGLRALGDDAEAERRHAIRVNLAAWSRHVPVLRAVLPIDRAMMFAVSRDGQFLAVGSFDGRVRVWDFPAMRERPLQGHQLHNKIISLTFSPDGKTLAVSYGEYSDKPVGREGVQLWNVETGERAGLLSRDAVPWRLSFRPDGRELAVGYFHGEACVWDVAARRVRLELPIPRPFPKQVNIHTLASFSPDGRTVLCSARGLTGLHWQCAADDGRLFGEPVEHGNQVNAVSYSPDGQTFVVTVQDEAIRHYRSAGGAKIGERTYGMGWDWGDPEFGPDGRQLLASFSSRVEVLDLPEFRPHGWAMNHPDTINHYAWGAGGETVVTLANDNRVRVWEVPRLPSRAASDRPKPARNDRQAVGESEYAASAIDPVSGVTAVAVRPIAANGGVGQTRLIDSATGRPAAPPVVHPRWRVERVALSANGRVGATAMSRHQVGGVVQVWDARTGAALAPPIAQTNMVGAVALSPDGRFVAVSNFHEYLQVYHTADGRPAWPRPVKQSDIGLSLAFRPDGAALAGGTSRERHLRPDVALWDAATGEPVAPPMGHEVSAAYLEFSPDGRRLASVAGQFVRLWDARTGAAASGQLIHPGGSVCVCFSPDSRLLAGAGADGTARLWDADTGRPLPGSGLPHPAAVAAVAFSPDGRTLATGCTDGGVRLWDVATRKRLGPAFVHAAAVHRLAVSADGSRVIAVDEGGNVRSWPVPAPAADESQQQLAARLEVLTGLAMDSGRVINALETDDWLKRRDELAADDGGRIRPLADPLTADEWHQFRATDADEDGDAFAALWQWQRLSRLRPGDDGPVMRECRIRAAAGDFAAASNLDARIQSADAAAWHRQAAADAALVRRFELALWHLDRAAARTPDDADLAAERGRVLARLQRWSASKSEWDRAIAGRPVQWDWHFERGEVRGQLGDPAGRDADREAAIRLGAGREDIAPLLHEYTFASRWADVARLCAVLHERGMLGLTYRRLWAVAALLTGDRDGYLRLCRQAEPMPPNPRYTHLEPLAWLFVLGPRTAEDGPELLKLADAMRQLGKQSPAGARRDFARSLQGALLYRAGRFAEAEAAFAQCGDTFDPGGWLFRAMTLAKLRRFDEARTWHEKARAVTIKDPVELAICRDILLPEAETVLREQQ